MVKISVLALFIFFTVAFTPGTDREMGTDKNKHMKVNPKSATTMVL